MAQSSFNIPRHWWGKIIGGVLGLLKGGLGGAVVGVILGHMVDRFIAGYLGVGATQRAFFDSLFAVLGHIAKADGRVTPDEIRMVEDLMRQMQISGEDRQRAIRQFNRGKQPDFDLQAALRPFVQHSAVRPDLRQMYMEILVEAAFSSGDVTPAEQDVLLRVARALRIPGVLFAAMMAARSPSGTYQGRQGQGAWGGTGGGAGRRANHVRNPLDQAYAHLGLKSNASDAEVKKAYRKLVSQYHPDKLVSRGLPEEMMEMARVRVREINVAYEQIKEVRGFK